MMSLSEVIDYFGARYYASDLSVWLSVDPPLPLDLQLQINNRFFLQKRN